MHKVETIHVEQADEGKRLDVYLSWQLALSRSFVQKLIIGNLVMVNGEYAKVSRKVREGDILCVTVPAPRTEEVLPEDIPLDVLYEDDDMIAVNKPRGLVVHPASGNWSGTLVNALLAHSGKLSTIGGRQRPGIVHRLDKDTSGCQKRHYTFGSCARSQATKDGQALPCNSHRCSEREGRVH